MVMEAEQFPGSDLAPWEASTQNDPEQANQLTEQAMAAAPTMPEVEPPPSNVAELPGGFIDPVTGQPHRLAVVRELTGRDEEALARIDTLKSPSSFVRTITKLGVMELGGVTPSDAALGMLLVGDRNALVLAIRRTTLGNQLPMEIVCPACEAKESVAIELDKDIPVRTLADPMQRVFTVDLSVGTAQVMLATAEIEDQMLDMTKATLPERNTHMLRRCVMELNGQPPLGDQILDLSMSDRRKLLDTLFDNQPGPQYGEVSLPCARCDAVYPLNITLGDLFRY